MFKLKKGDKVAIVAPSGQIGGKEPIEKALAYLQSLGLEPIFGQHLFKQNRYMAGSDTDRAADINAAFANPEIKTIFCARAAAGATRILPLIDYNTARQNPKPLIGFCDNAALMTALWQKSGITSLNGFLLAYDFKNGAPTDLVKTQFESWLSGKAPLFKSGTCVQAGTARGTLLPINLSVLMRLAGTPYFPDLRDTILVLEDVHERVHKIDLMLQQLKQQPHFNAISGLLFGDWTDCAGDAEDGAVDDCLDDFLQDIHVPVIKNFNFGHTPERFVLPLGAKVQINAAQTELQILSE